MANTSTQPSEDGNEQTPLLLGNVNNATTTPSQPTGLLERIGGLFRPWLSAQLAFSRDNSHDFDADQITRHRARLSSYPSLPDPEGLKKLQSRKQASTAPSGNFRGNEGDIQEPIEEGAAHGASDATTVGQDAEEQAPNGDGKYIGVSATRFWLIFLTILLGYFVACFDITLMASSHPVITSYFHASESASWLTTVFMITNTGFQPLWGRLSDTVGRKSVYLLVLAIFGLTNLWCALSQSIESFIAARAFCGLGAGGTMSMGLVMLNDLVYVEQRGIYISHVNVAFGLGSACGAAFGGLLCDSLGWRWSFGLQVPVLALCGISAILTTPNGLGPMLMRESGKGLNKEENPAWNAIKTFDSLGVITLVFAVSSLILFLNLGGNLFPWTHWVVILSLVFSILGTAAFVLVERRAQQPVMPLAFLFKPPVANLIFSNFLAGVASNTVLFNVPLWFQAVRLTSATKSGLLLAAPSIGTSIAGTSTGYIITYTKRLKPLLLLGAILYVAGSIALCFISESSSIVVSTVLITGVPLAQGFVYPGSMMSAFSVSQAEDQAVVTTTISLWRNLGIVVGVAVSSLVLQNVLKLRLEETVEGPDKDEIVRLVRGSVRSIKDLSQPYLDQVIDSYAFALKMTFLVSLVASVILLCVVAPVRLPRLRQGKKQVAAGE